MGSRSAIPANSICFSARLHRIYTRRGREPKNLPPFRPPKATAPPERAPAGLKTAHNAKKRPSNRRQHVALLAEAMLNRIILVF